MPHLVSMMESKNWMKMMPSDLKSYGILRLFMRGKDRDKATSPPIE